MAVRQALGVVGAVVGAYFGAPQLGYAIGSAIGGVVDPLVIKGPSLGDLATQTAQEGGPRPIVFGLSQPMAGNIIASGPARKVKKKTTQGKGGPKVVTEHVFRTYAVGICEGPITKVVRVWRNAELVYADQTLDQLNIHDSVGFGILDVFIRLTSNNQRTREHARFYLGDYAQEPNEDLEEDFGVGTTGAFRGTAYMVVANDDLTDQRGAIPQYTFQVERCEGFFLTSPPYPLVDVAPMTNTAPAPEESPSAVDLGALDESGAVLGGDLFATLIEYGDGEPEALEESGTVFAGDMARTLIEYGDGEPEALEQSGVPLSGEMLAGLIEYDDGEPEAITSTGSVREGTLE